MKNGAANADRNFTNFSEFCIFFTIEQKWLFQLSSGEECKFVFTFITILAKNMQIFLQNGDANSQKLQKMQTFIKSPFRIFFQKFFEKFLFLYH